MIQISNTGVTSDAEQAALLREEFRAVNCVRIRQVLDPSLLGFLQHRLEKAEWKSKIHEEIGVEYVTEDRPALHLCHFLANLKVFRALIEELTECGPLNLFTGRVYRMIPALGHYDSWHNDVIENRLVGMSINLSPLGFRGGLFQLRGRGAENILAQVSNTGFGDILLFKISPELEHRVSAIEGDEPKTAFAGWFRSERGDYFDDLIKSARKAVVTA